MIDAKIEEFTAEEASAAGLGIALIQGSTQLEGTFQFNHNNKRFEMKQKNIVFKDNIGNLRVCKFKNEVELLKFFNIYTS